MNERAFTESMVEHSALECLGRRGYNDGPPEWCGKRLAISEELGDCTSMASSISQLGVLSVERGDLVEAVSYFVRSFSIRKAIGSPEIRIDLHWLGKVKGTLGEKRFEELLRQHGMRPSDLGLQEKA